MENVIVVTLKWILGDKYTKIWCSGFLKPYIGIWCWLYKPTILTATFLLGHFTVNVSVKHNDESWCIIVI